MNSFPLEEEEAANSLVREEKEVPFSKLSFY